MTHTGKTSFSCETCMKKFNQAGNLRTHQMSHTGEKSFTCETCLKKFSQAGHLMFKKASNDTHWGEIIHM